jgi:hypothetical protein
LYGGVNKNGEQFALPVQAKGGNDRLSVVQTAQDIACCREKFAGLTCRSIAAQFVTGDVIPMFELALDGEDVKLVEENTTSLPLGGFDCGEPNKDSCFETPHIEQLAGILSG